MTSVIDCSPSNDRCINVQGQMQSGLELTDSLESAPQGMAINLPTTVKNICPPWADKDAAFIRRLENLPPEQESQVKIPYSDVFVVRSHDHMRVFVISCAWWMPPQTTCTRTRCDQNHRRMFLQVCRIFSLTTRNILVMARS